MIEDKLEEEYRKSIYNKIEDSDNQLKLEDRCVDCYEEMKEYILNCGLMVGQNLNCQNLINFIKGDKGEKGDKGDKYKVYKDFELKLVSIKKNSGIKRRTLK